MIWSVTLQFVICWLSDIKGHQDGVEWSSIVIAGCGSLQTWNSAKGHFFVLSEKLGCDSIVLFHPVLNVARCVTYTFQMKRCWLQSTKIRGYVFSFWMFHNVPVFKQEKLARKDHKRPLQFGQLAKSPTAGSIGSPCGASPSRRNNKHDENLDFSQWF